MDKTNNNDKTLWWTVGIIGLLAIIGLFMMGSSAANNATGGNGTRAAVTNDANGNGVIPGVPNTGTAGTGGTDKTRYQDSGQTGTTR